MVRISKQVPLAATVLLVALALAGCGHKSDSDQTPAAQASASQQQASNQKLLNDPRVSPAQKDAIRKQMAAQGSH